LRGTGWTNKFLLKMEAIVQYNDFIGTVAADQNGYATLEGFLQEKNIDSHRYQCIGVKFFASSKDYFSMGVMCMDRRKTNDKENPYIVSIDFENEIDKDEFFDLFKRFEAIIYNRYSTEYQDFDIEEEISYKEAMDNNETN
jgi:hypothetical protein